MAYGNFRRGGFNRGPRRSFGGPREMHKIKCSECGKEDEVPFKPSQDRTVFCKACFMKKKGIEPRESKAEVSEEAEAEEAEEVEDMEEAEDEEEQKEAA